MTVVHRFVQHVPESPDGTDYVGANSLETDGKEARHNFRVATKYLKQYSSVSQTGDLRLSTRHGSPV